MAVDQTRAQGLAGGDLQCSETCVMDVGNLDQESEDAEEQKRQCASICHSHNSPDLKYLVSSDHSALDTYSLRNKLFHFSSVQGSTSRGAEYYTFVDLQRLLSSECRGSEWRSKDGGDSAIGCLSEVDFGTGMTSGSLLSSSTEPCTLASKLRARLPSVHNLTKTRPFFGISTLFRVN